MSFSFGLDIDLWLKFRLIYMVHKHLLFLFYYFASWKFPIVWDWITYLIGYFNIFFKGCSCRNPFCIYKWGILLLNLTSRITVSFDLGIVILYLLFNDFISHKHQLAELIGDCLPQARALLSLVPSCRSFFRATSRIERLKRALPSCTQLQIMLRTISWKFCIHLFRCIIHHLLYILVWHKICDL